ncbi:MAG: outer membrane protein [Syntrophales bacterium]
MKKIVVCLAVILMLSFAAQAEAAGWYLRGAAGFEQGLAADFSDDDAAATNALFGVGPGSDGRGIHADGDFGTVLGLEAALGKQILPWLRAELALTYRPSMQYRAQANFRGVTGDQPVSARADSLSGTANLYLDVAGLPGVRLGRFQPYLGGGLGVARNWLGGMTYEFPGLATHKVTVTPGGSRTDVAFLATIGTGIVLTERLVLDVAYRYTDLGRVATDSGRMYLNHIPAGADVDGTWAPLRTHGLFAGVRYLFK